LVVIAPMCPFQNTENPRTNSRPSHYLKQFPFEFLSFPPLAPRKSLPFCRIFHSKASFVCSIMLAHFAFDNWSVISKASFHLSGSRKNGDPVFPSSDLKCLLPKCFHFNATEKCFPMIHSSTTGLNIPHRNCSPPTDYSTEHTRIIPFQYIGVIVIIIHTPGFKIRKMFSFISPSKLLPIDAEDMAGGMSLMAGNSSPIDGCVCVGYMEDVRMTRQNFPPRK
jgi:hypothetical protein